MSESERIYALLVEANPIPDPDVLPERLSEVEPHLHVVDPGRTTMQTQPTIDQSPPETPKRHTGWIAAAVAAVVVLAVGIGAMLLLANDDNQPVVDEPPATTAAPATTLPQPEAAPDTGISAQEQARFDEAIAKVEDFYAALNADDLDAAIAVLAPDGNYEDINPAAEADRNMWDFNAVGAQRYPFQIESCEGAGALDDRVMIECTMAVSDPVWIELGLTEAVAPWYVFADGQLDWLPLRGSAFSLPNQAYVDYMQLNHLEAYDEVCNPEAYALGSVNHPQELALTRACAELVTPLAVDIAASIEAGEPES